jgi:hypothetical protein
MEALRNWKQCPWLILCSAPQSFPQCFHPHHSPSLSVHGGKGHGSRIIFIEDKSCNVLERILYQNFQLIEFNFSGWGETESTWYVSNYLAYCISPRWLMMSGTVCEMRTYWENQSTQRKTAQCHIVHMSYIIWPGLYPRLLLWEADDWPPELSHGLQNGYI